MAKKKNRNKKIMIKLRKNNNDNLGLKDKIENK